MKKLLCVLSISITIISCHNADSKQTEFISAPKDTSAKKDFSHVVFATQKDTSCGMPLKYGIEDSLHFDGKIYGFCSKGCKDAFVAQLKKENKL